MFWMCLSASQQFVFRYTGHLKSPSETPMSFCIPCDPITDDPVSVTVIFLLLDRARCLQKSEICAHTLFTIDQNSPWCTSNYTEENNKWLWVIFSSGCWRMHVCDDIWKVPGTAIDDKLEPFQREISSINASKMALLSFLDITWRNRGAELKVICLHLSLRITELLVLSHNQSASESNSECYS